MLDLGHGSILHESMPLICRGGIFKGGGTGMKEKYIGFLENGLIWFGAGDHRGKFPPAPILHRWVSGTGLFAILLGHVIGCTMFFLAGLIRERPEKFHGRPSN